MGDAQDLKGLLVRSSIQLLSVLYDPASTTQLISIPTSSKEAAPVVTNKLEPSLWMQLQSARLTPEAVDLLVLLNQAEPAIAQLPESVQMLVAADVML